VPTRVLRGAATAISLCRLMHTPAERSACAAVKAYSQLSPAKLALRMKQEVAKHLAGHSSRSDRDSSQNTRGSNDEAAILGLQLIGFVEP